MYTCTMTQVKKTRRRSPGPPATPLQAAACCRPVDGLLDPEFFKALCDPTRLWMLACLIKCTRPCSVGEIAACCDVDLSVVSRHLQVLARAGVLQATRKGREVFYAVRTAEICQRLRSLANAIDASCADRSCCS